MKSRFCLDFPNHILTMKKIEEKNNFDLGEWYSEFRISMEHKLVQYFVWDASIYNHTRERKILKFVFFYFAFDICHRFIPTFVNLQVMISHLESFPTHWQYYLTEPQLQFFGWNTNSSTNRLLPSSFKFHIYV